MSNSPIGLGVKVLADGANAMAKTIIILAIVAIITVPLAIYGIYSIVKHFL